jgi:hypothetical protein
VVVLSFVGLRVAGPDVPWINSNWGSTSGRFVRFVTADLIPEIAPDANMPEGVAADSSGIIYGG